MSFDLKYILNAGLLLEYFSCVALLLVKDTSTTTPLLGLGGAFRGPSTITTRWRARDLVRCPPPPPARAQRSAHWLARQYKVPQWFPHWLPLCLTPLPEEEEEEEQPRGFTKTLPSLFPLSLLFVGRVASICSMKERRLAQPCVARCKLVLVGDVQCGKTAMLQVLAKDCYPEVRHII